MTGRHEDLTGQVFGRLTVVEYSHSVPRTCWKCLCECGEHSVVQAYHLKSGHTTSCGCRQRESAAMRLTTHGMRFSSEYCIWKQMLQRCSNPKDSGYSNYGGRGIAVCPEWSSFEQFYADMGPRPSKDHSIDRVDNSGDYSKDNCRWVTRKEQCNNRRSNRMLTHNGETKTVTQWAEELGLNLNTVQNRLYCGWPVDKSLTTPIKRRITNS